METHGSEKWEEIRWGCGKIENNWTRRSISQSNTNVAGLNDRIFCIFTFSLTFSPNISHASPIFACRTEAGFSSDDSAEFCDAENHGKVYEDELIWKILKIASRVLGMIIDLRYLFTFVLSCPTTHATNKRESYKAIFLSILKQKQLYLIPHGISSVSRATLYAFNIN